MTRSGLCSWAARTQTKSYYETLRRDVIRTTSYGITGPALRTTECLAIELNMNKSLSDSNLNESSNEMNNTPPNFVFGRAKKRKEQHSPIDAQCYDKDSELCNLKEEMREMFSSLLSAQREEFNKINPTLKKLHETNSKIESSIEFLSQNNLELQKRIELLEQQKKEDSRYIAVLEDKMENLLKSTRKANFELKNVPKKERESKDDLINMVTCLSSSVGASLNRSDIADIYRVNGKKERVTSNPIVVETKSTIIKTDLLHKCKLYNKLNKTKIRAKHLGFTMQEENPVFICEQLTPKASRLHFLARDLVKSTAFTFCWTAYGNVYVRKDENSPIITITNDAQIKQLYHTP